MSNVVLLIWAWILDAILLLLLLFSFVDRCYPILTELPGFLQVFKYLPLLYGNVVEVICARGLHYRSQQEEQGVSKADKKRKPGGGFQPNLPSLARLRREPFRNTMYPISRNHSATHLQLHTRKKASVGSSVYRALGKFSLTITSRPDLTFLGLFPCER